MCIRCHVLQKLGHTEAFDCLEEALAIRREMGDLRGEAQALLSLADAYYRLKGPQEAYDHSLRHMAVLRQAGNPADLGVGLNNHGEFCLELGKLEEAAGNYLVHRSTPPSPLPWPGPVG